MKSSPKHEGSEHLFLSALNQSPSIILITDLKGCITYSNKEAQKQLNRHQNELIKTSLTEWGINLNWADLLSTGTIEEKIYLHSGPYSLEAKILEEIEDSILITGTHIPHEHKLEELERQLKEYQRLMKVGTWSFDGKTDLYNLSDEIYELLGENRSDYPMVRLDDLFQYVHPDDIGLLTNEFQKIIEGESSQVDFRMTIHETSLWIRATSRAVLDENGNFIRSYGIMQDITDRMQSEKHYRQQLDLYTMMSDIAQVAAWEYDLRSDKAQYTKTLKTILNIPDDQSAPDQLEFLELIPLENRHIFQNLYERLVTEKQPVSEETKIRIKDTKWLSVKINAQPVIQKDECVKIRGTLQVLDHEHLQGASAHSEMFLKQAMKVAKLGSWILDEETKRVQWSDTMFEIFEKDPTPNSEIHADDYPQLVHPEDAHKILPENLTIKSDGTRGYEYRIVTQKGAIKDVFNTEGVRLRDSKLLFGVVQDITYLKENQRQLEKAQEALKEKLKTENTLSKVSLIFNSLKSLDEKINQTLETIGQHTDCHRVFIYENAPNNQTASNTYEWCKTGISSLIGQQSLFYYHDCPSWDSLISEHGLIMASDLDNLSDDIKEQFARREISSMLIIPLTSGEQKLGFIGFDNYVATKQWKEVLLLQVIATIISDAILRKNMDESLRKREAELVEVQRMALISRFEADLITDQILISDEIAQTSGLNPGWQPLRNAIEIIHPEDAKALKDYYTKCIQDKKNFNYTYRIIHPTTNEEKSIITSGYLTYDEHLNPVRYIGTHQDITHSVYQKHKIEEANSQLENILHNVPGAVYQRKTDNFDDLTFLNAQTTEIFGFAPEDFTPKGTVRYFDLVHEYDQEMLKKEISDSVKNETAYELTYRISDKEGNEQWIWDRGDFVNIGKEKYIQGIMVNITNRIKSEDRLLSATLQAEDAERRRISHEINDGVQQRLISAMYSFQNIEQYIGEIPEDHIYKQFQKAMELLKTGIGETRSVAYNIMPKSIEDFGLVKTLESMTEQLNKISIATFSFYTNVREKRFSQKIETSLYRICREAVNNILNYAEASEATIQFTMHQNDISLTIEDNGSGFDSKEQNLLHTGFGISYMKSRANAIGGSFELNSRPGKGTCILVAIPNYRE